MSIELLKVSSPRYLWWAIAAVLLAACGDDDRRGGGAPSADLGVVGPDAGLDVSLGDVGLDAGDTGASEESPGCRDDELEPSSLAAPPLVDGATTFEDLVICPFNDDWFRIAVVAGQRLDAAIRFDHAEGDLELGLWSESLELLARSETDADEERVVYGAPDDGTVLLRVFGFDGATNRYRLEVAFESLADSCDGDPEEPNDSAEQAWMVEAPFVLESRLCPEDEDWFGLAVPSGSSLSARLELDHDLGDLDLRAYLSSSPAEPLQVSNSESDVERILVGPFDQDATVLIEIVGYRGAFNTYQLRLQTYDGNTAELSVSGHVGYEDRPFGPEGFTGERVDRPARGVRVELVREFDGAVVGEARTDDEGDFGLTAGVHAAESYYVRALATVAVGGFTGRVEDRSAANAVYALAGEPFQVEPGGVVEDDLLASADAPVGGAFNVMDVTYEAFAFLSLHADPANDVLTYRWEPGRSFFCGSCYDDDVVSLGGRSDDPDEYDDDIILHEFGHFFQDNLSADSSPGGDHEGEKLDPLLAYGEGMATFFSSMVQNDPDYVDIYIDSLRLRNLETADEDAEAFYGTEDGTLTGDVSEYLVSAVMWDAFDPASEAEPFDTLALGAGDIMSVFLDYVTRSDRPEIGVRGIDLADWINGITCLRPQAAEPLARICQDDREYPWDPEVDSVCAEKARDGAMVEIFRQGDRLWLDFVGRNPAATRVTAYLEGGQGVQSLAFDCEASPCPLPFTVSVDESVAVAGEVHGRAFRTAWVGALARERLMGGGRLADSPIGAVREFRQDVAGPHGPVPYTTTRFRPRFLAR